MQLNGSGFPDGAGQPGDADLHQTLIIVIDQEIWVGNDALDGGKHFRQITDHKTIFQAEQITSLYNKKNIALKS